MIIKIAYLRIKPYQIYNEDLKVMHNMYKPKNQ